MKKLCMLTAAALALMLLAGCSAQEETEPLPESMDQETVLAAGEEILNQLLDGEYEAVYGEFREDIRANLTVESVQELIESETQEAGTYEGIEKADTIGSTEGEEHGIARFLCNTASPASCATSQRRMWPSIWPLTPIWSSSACPPASRPPAGASPI